MSRTPTSPTSTAVPARVVWTRTRGLLAGLAILVIGAIALAAVRSGDHHGRLDPRSADKLGSRAVAELLKGQGITVTPATTLAEVTAAAGPDTTVLVTTPDLLTPRQQRTLSSAVNGAGRTVLLAPGPASLGTLAPGVTNASAAPVENLQPACDLPAATRAGSVLLGGETYTSSLPASQTELCYPSDGDPALVRVKGVDGDLVVLGAPDLLYNDRLDEQGNASLALQLLGSRTHLVWYLPSLSDPSLAEGSSDESSEEGDVATGFLSLVPSGWLWGTLQLAVAALLAAVWRARRLGPLVTERLPVAIRASETTEGRARLYRRAGARDRAATVLRTATRTRIAPLLGVAPRDAHAPDALLPAVSARLPESGRDLRDLLYGPAPADDAALIRLADQLDALEREVRTS
ncbi:DUF4350 domain-containing protein [Streptomyces sp. NPDC048604]|uniref:DUF4350 domain-containing protein n=1 Tax=Streptomyces sp. NPDC048604 TaxID=3365578 RepID=UPI00371BEB8A